MKKIALVGGGLMAMNIVANIGLVTARKLAVPVRTGGVSSLAFLAAPVAKFLATPVPINYRQMAEDAKAGNLSFVYSCQRATINDAAG